MNEIQQGLLIAAIGMGLVFAVIIFLWGLMALMMKLTSKPERAEELPADVDHKETAKISGLDSYKMKRRAVAAAVAVGLAISSSQTSHLSGHQREPASGPSAWQSFHRTRHLENKSK